MTDDTTKYPRLWEDVAIERGMKVDKDGNYNGADCGAVGVASMNGCPSCGACVAPYNSYQISDDNPYTYCRGCA